MRPSLSLREFLNQYQHKLDLSFSSDRIGLDREIQVSRQASNTFDAADYFNVIRTSSIAVVGFQESRYINKLSPSEQQRLFNNLFRGPVCVIICIPRAHPIDREHNLLGTVFVDRVGAAGPSHL